MLAAVAVAWVEVYRRGACAWIKNCKLWPRTAVCCPMMNRRCSMTCLRICGSAVVWPACFLPMTLGRLCC